MKKLIKAALSLFMVMALMFSLSGCGEEKKAEAAVNNMITAFKNLDFEEAQKYVDMDDIKTSDGDEVMGDSNMLFEAVFDRLECTIISSEKIDSDTVNVTAEITAVDMEPVMQDYFAQALEYAFSTAFADPQPTEEEIAEKTEEMLKSAVSKDDLEMMTTEVVIKVVKSDDGWKIDADDEFANALTGGLLDVMEDFSDTSETE